MELQLRFLRAIAFAIGMAALAWSGAATADPPSRVARLGYMSGAVSFSPSGEDDWVQATLNRPLTTGDRVWADDRARAEIQIGGAAIRMNADTDVSILNLDDQIAQFQLTQGVLGLRVRNLEPGQAFEVDTPNLALTIRHPGTYRVEVDPDGIATTIFVRNGQAEVYGEGAAYTIDSHQPYRFTGTGLREYQYVDMPNPDDFDRWASERDRSYDNSRSVRYVSADVVGYQDLDAYGAWEQDPTYGYVWIPARVGPGWAPYRDGHWVWVDPWGWTWVDDAPWGYAVSHYGRWAYRRDRWCWVPGPVQTRAYYAPALVAFVGGPNFQLSISTGNVGGVAWFPLAPREVYRPSYVVSRRYFENVNVSNTVVNKTVINNYYNNTNITNVVYANRKVPGAVVAVPETTLVRSQPVARQVVHVEKDWLVSRPVAVAPHVAPTEKSVHGAAPEGGRPPEKVGGRSVVARAEPPAPRPNFAAQREKLAVNQGRPLGDDARKELKPNAGAMRPEVKVIGRREEARPNERPPAVADREKPRDSKPDEARGRGDERKREERERNAANAPREKPAPPPPQQREEAPRPPRQDEAQRPPRQDEAPKPPRKEEGPRPPRQDQAARPPERDERVARPPERRDNSPQRAEKGARRDEPDASPPSARTPRQPEVPRPPSARAPEQRDRPEQREREAPQPPQARTRPPREAPPPNVDNPRQRQNAEPRQAEPPRPPMAEVRPPQQRAAPNPEPREQERRAGPRKKERDDDKK
jgi:hypothetical protein